MKMSILAGLAHVNRCLFPGDFEEELKKLGIDAFTAYELSKEVKKGKGIVQIYQSALQYNEPYQTEICDALDKYIKEFQKEYKWDLEK